MYKLLVVKVECPYNMSVLADKALNDDLTSFQGRSAKNFVDNPRLEANGFATYNQITV